MLSLETRSVFGSSREGALDAEGGVSMSVAETGLDSHGRRQAAVRFVSATGAFDVRCADVPRAHELRRLVESMLAEAGIRTERE
jgi:hypothetical protein